MTPRNRIRSFTRWPEDREARIESAKVEIGVAAFWNSIGRMDGLLPGDELLGAIPEPFLRRAQRAFDVLCDDGVPVELWDC